MAKYCAPGTKTAKMPSTAKKQKPPTSGSPMRQRKLMGGIKKGK